MCGLWDPLRCHLHFDEDALHSSVFPCKTDSEKINHISQREIESQQLLSGLTVFSDEEADNLLNIE